MTDDKTGRASVLPLHVMLFALGAIVIAAGIPLQLAGVTLASGGTTFGLMSKLGGTLILAGLLRLALRATPPAQQPPFSARGPDRVGRR